MFGADMRDGIIDEITEIYYIDGASKGNPGEAYCGIHHHNMLTKWYLGIQTNNFAEYMGLIYALIHALRQGYKRVLIKTDSQLVIGQVMKGWKFTNSSHLEVLCEIAKSLIFQFQYVKLEKIKSNENKADLK